MNRKLLGLVAAGILGLSATSCLDNDENKVNSTVTRTYSDCFAVVSNSGSSVVESIDTRLTYNFSLNTYSDGSTSVSIRISDLSISPEISHTTFELPVLKLRLSPEGGYIADATAVKPVKPASIASVEFSRVSFRMYDVIESLGMGLQPTLRTVYGLELEVNGRYRVNTFPTRMLLYGTTKTISAVTQSEFVATTPRYALTINPEKLTATIDITGAQFVQQMPAMNMTFPDIPITIGASTVSLRSDAFDPTIAGIPYEDFAITDLSAAVSAAPAAVNPLTFRCAPPRMGLFEVTCALSQLPAK